MIDKILSYLPTENTTLMIIIGVLALIIVFAILKSLFKIAMFAVIIGAIAVFGFGMTTDEVINKGKELASYGTEFINDKITPLVMTGIEDMEVTKKEDGTYILDSKQIQIKTDSSDKTLITIKSLDTTFTLEELSKYISPEDLEKVKQSIKNAIAGI